MGYQFFLPMVLRWRASRAEAPLLITWNYLLLFMHYRFLQQTNLIFMLDLRWIIPRQFPRLILNMGWIISPSLDKLAVSLWGWCIFRNILLSAQHIPGKSNRGADSLSRQFVLNLEWSLDQDVFNRLVVITFLPDIDLFACRSNAKLDQFVSWHPEQEELAVDAFSISWSSQRFYAFPPFSVLSGDIEFNLGPEIRNPHTQGRGFI